MTSLVHMIKKYNLGLRNIQLKNIGLGQETNILLHNTCQTNIFLLKNIGLINILLKNTCQTNIIFY